MFATPKEIVVPGTREALTPVGSLKSLIVAVKVLSYLKCVISCWHFILFH